MTGSLRTKILNDRTRRARAFLAEIEAESCSPELERKIDSIFRTPSPSPSPSFTPGTIDSCVENPVEIMVDFRGQHTANNGFTKYYGGSSGFCFLQQTQQFLYRNLYGCDMPADPHLIDAISNLFDSPQSEMDSSSHFSILESLPPRDTVRGLFRGLSGQIVPLLQFMDEPTFQEQTDRFYHYHLGNVADYEHDFLPLLFLVIALGFRLHPKWHEQYGCEGAFDQAHVDSQLCELITLVTDCYFRMRYFYAARQIVVLDRPPNILYLQTVLCFVIFLMSTSQLTTAHTFVGLAISASLKMGLHSQAFGPELPKVHEDIRQRIFRTVVDLDIYCGAVLGVPRMIGLGNVGKHSWSCTPSRSLSALLFIISKTVRNLYPTAEAAACRSEWFKFEISNATITEIEDDFKKWRERKTDVLDHLDPHDDLILHAYELEMAYLFGQILLYQPFLHHLAKTQDARNPHGSRYARKGVAISRCTISQSNDMIRQGVHMPISWSSMYTLFLSLATLIFYLATQPGGQEYVAILKETECGIRVLASISCRNVGLRSCLDVLRMLSKKFTHRIDLDIDKVLENAPPLCTMVGQSPQGKQNGFQYLDNNSGEAPREQNQSRKAQANEVALTTSGHGLAHRPATVQSEMTAPRWFPEQFWTYQSSVMASESQMSLYQQPIGLRSGAYPQPQPTLEYTHWFSQSGQSYADASRPGTDLVYGPLMQRD